MTQHWPDPHQRRPVDIAAYAPPRRRGPTMWLVVGALLLAGIVLAVLVARPASAPGPTPTPTPEPTVASAGSGLPFAMPGDSEAQGRWEVVSTEWRSDGVQLQVRIVCDTRAISYGFIAFSNASTEVYDPQSSDRRPSLSTGTLRAGETITGWVFVPLPPGDATLILTTAAGNQVSALPIDG